MNDETPIENQVAFVTTIDDSQHLACFCKGPDGESELDWYAVFGQVYVLGGRWICDDVGDRIRRVIKFRGLIGTDRGSNPVDWKLVAKSQLDSANKLVQMIEKAKSELNEYQNQTPYLKGVIGGLDWGLSLVSCLFDLREFTRENK